MQAMQKELKELKLAMKEIEALKQDASSRNVNLEKDEELEVDVKRHARSLQDKDEAKVAEMTHNAGEHEGKPEAEKAYHHAVKHAVEATVATCPVEPTVAAYSSKSPEKNEDEETARKFARDNLPGDVYKKLMLVRTQIAKGEVEGKIRRTARCKGSVPKVYHRHTVS